MAATTADVLAVARPGKQKSLSKSAELDILVKGLKSGNRQARKEMKLLLVADKVTPNTTDDRGTPLIHAACEGGMESFVHDLLHSWKADANLLDELGNTGLHICQLFGGGEWIKLWETLEQASCDGTAVNAFGLKASEMSRDAIVSQLFRVLSEDCKTGEVLRTLNSQASGGEVVQAPGSVMFGEAGATAAQNGKIKMRKTGEDIAIKAMMRKFATGLERDEHGKTLLMYAAGAGSMDLAKYMYKMKCDANAQDKEGNTALHHAVMNQEEVIAAFIVRKGADTRTRNAAGRTAMEVRKEIQDALEAARNANGKKEERKKVKADEKLDRLEEVRSPEMEAIYKKFLLAANSEAAIGLGKGARTGRGSSKKVSEDDEDLPVAKSLARNETLNYSEYMAFLRGEGLVPAVLSLTVASEVFRGVSKKFAHEDGFEAGELHWIHFKDCLYQLAERAGQDPFLGIPRAELIPVKPMTKRTKKEWDSWNLDNHTKECLQKDINWMQRQLFIMADRAKEITSLDYVSVGKGVTTGRKKMRQETMGAYCTPLRVKTTKLYMPQFNKSREVEKKEIVAKHFFNQIDKDKSGTLSRHELKSALDDFGFTDDEKDEVFSLVDADGSGSVSLNEFCQGLSKTNVQFEGRVSTTNRMESYHAIALNVSKKSLAIVKGDKVGPGFSAQIFKFLTAHAIEHRLCEFEANSRIYAAPKISATCLQEALPSLNLKKCSPGVNTMFAALCPFNDKVLKSLTPNASFEESFEDDDHEEYPFDFHDEDKEEEDIVRCSTPGSMAESVLVRRSRKTASGVTIDPTLDLYKNEAIHSREHTGGSRPGTKDRSTASILRTAATNPSRGLQTGYSSFSRQRTSFGRSHVKTEQTAHREGKTSKTVEWAEASPSVPAPQVSPDGKLLSEHTRITVLPHRLSITTSNQLLLGPVDLKEFVSPPAMRPISTAKRPTTTFSQVPACALVTHRAESKCAKKPLVARQKLAEDGKNGDLNLLRLPQVKAGLMQLNAISIRCISHGAGHCIAVSEMGIAYTWGSGMLGQLGHGVLADDAIPRPVQKIRTQIMGASAGMSHSAFVTAGGVVYTCGDGREGRLGHHDNAPQLKPHPVAALMDSVHAVAVQAGGGHTLVLSQQGEVFSWGCGFDGRLGTGAKENINYPVLIAALEGRNVVSIAAGAAHSVAMTQDGDILTWGAGAQGRLGHGASSNEILPREVKLSAHATVRAVSVAAGDCHTCVLRSDGSIVTWGRVTHGRTAEGVACEAMQPLLTQALQMQTEHDWHHFPD